MPTLDATTGGASANSYASIAEAQVYMDTLVPSTLIETWDSAGEEDQGKALQMATRLLDTWFEWYGFVSSTDQALLWPRSGVIDRNGYEVPTDEVPQGIVDATSELARQLLAGDRTADSDIEANKLKSLKAGPVELTFGGGVSSKPVPDAVMVMASFYGTLRSRSGGGTVHLYRG